MDEKANPETATKGNEATIHLTMKHLPAEIYRTYRSLRTAAVFIVLLGIPLVWIFTMMLLYSVVVLPVIYLMVVIPFCLLSVRGALNPSHESREGLWTGVMYLSVIFIFVVSVVLMYTSYKSYYSMTPFASLAIIGVYMAFFMMIFSAIAWSAVRNYVKLMRDIPRWRRQVMEKGVVPPVRTQKAHRSLRLTSS